MQKVQQTPPESLANQKLLDLLTDHPAYHTIDAIPSLLLYLNESHDSTALTLDMLDQTAQQLVVSTTTSAGTAVYVLLMDRTTDVRVQRPKRCKLSSAKIARVGLAIPRSFSCNGLDVVVAGHRQHGASDDIVSIHALNHGVDLLSVKAGLRAGSRLEVDL